MTVVMLLVVYNEVDDDCLLVRCAADEVGAGSDILVLDVRPLLLRGVSRRRCRRKMDYQYQKGIRDCI